MLGIKQTLHTAVASSEVDEMLAAGGRVVYLARRGAGEVGLWDAVIETEQEMGIDPRAIVLDFLVNVDPVALETKLANHPSLDQGMGKAILHILAEKVTGAPA